MPALALLLVRFGVPVLVHGPLEAQGRVAGAAVLRELGVLPCSSVHDAQLALADAGHRLRADRAAVAGRAPR